MAEFIIVSVKDKTMGEFMNPMFVHNQEEAKRLFKYQLTSNPIWKDNAEQFEMYDLGLLDTQTGNIIGNDEEPLNNLAPTIHPELICKGTDLIEVRKE